MQKYALYIFFLLTVLLILASCSATKHVPEGSYLLDDVKIITNNKNLKPSLLRPYLRQTPNAKLFSLFKSQLSLYSLSGKDSTRWINKVLRKIGDAPVIYDDYEAMRTEEELLKAVQNMGYMAATIDGHIEYKKKKLKVYYDINAGEPYIVETIKYDIPDTLIASYLRKDSINLLLKEGMIFDVNVLDNERQRIADYLLRNGYYKFNKDYIVYTADTVRGTCKVDLTMRMLPYKERDGSYDVNHPQFYINKISFIADYDVLQSSSLTNIDINDSINYKGYPIYFKDKLFIKPRHLVDNLTFHDGDLYNSRRVQQMYRYFGRMNALKYTNIRFFETAKQDSALLNCYIMLTKSKHKSISFELEGTNSAGDLGAAASVSFRHRNLFKGSETFMIRVRGAYEAITGLKGEYRNNNYTELGVETNLNFPNFLFPFLNSDFKRRINATTEFGLQYNYQLRPEFSRTIASEIGRAHV